MRGLISVIFALIFLLHSSILRAAGISERAAEWNNLRDKSAQSFDSKELDKSEATLRTALQLARASGNETHILTSVRELGVICEWTGKFEEAERLFAEALDIQSRLKGPDSPDLVVTLNYLGVAQRELQHYRASIDTHERALRCSLLSLRLTGPF